MRQVHHAEDARRRPGTDLRHIHPGGRPGGATHLDVKAATGFIPDAGGLFPRLSPWEHLELCEATDERAGEFSHGMSRKLSAAIALLPAPALLLADEPFDGVDLAGINMLSALLGSAAAGGAVVVVTTHLIGVAETLCDQVHLVKAGRVLACGTPADLAAGGSLAATYEQVLAAARQDAGR